MKLCIMKSKSCFLVCTGLFVLLFAGSTQALQINADEANSDWKRVPAAIPVAKENENCAEGEFQLDNGTCTKCYAHNSVCNASRQCCGVEHMNCWQYSWYEPMCKCDPGYSWDAQKQICFVVSYPQALVITAYVIAISAAVITIIALLVHSCKCCRRNCYNWRHRNEIRERHQFREAQRRRRISDILPRPTAEPLPEKPPTYEDVFGAPVTISQAVQQPRQMTGSLRSLPPAYTECDETPSHGICVVSDNSAAEQNSSSVVDLQSTDFNDRTQGVVNPLCTDDMHI